MKKCRPTLLFVSLIMTIFIVSCDKETDSSDYMQLVGHWAESPSCEQFHYIFKSDKTGSFYITDCTNNNTQITDTEYFNYNYEKSGELLKITCTKGPDAGETAEITIKSINREELHWSVKGNDYQWVFYKQ